MPEFNLQNFLHNTVHKTIKNGLEQYGKNNESIDKIIVWLVGFSITIVSLMLVNFNNDISVIKKSGDIIIILSTLAIFFGILQRIIMVICNKLQLDIYFAFADYVEGYNLPENTKYTRIFSFYENTLDEVLHYLEIDFGFVFEDTIPDSGTKEYNEKLKYLISKYDELQENLLVFEVNLFNESLSKQLGLKIPKITKETVEGENKSRINQKHRVLTLFKYSNWLFFLTCASFMSSILVGVITYLFQ